MKNLNIVIAISIGFLFISCFDNQQREMPELNIVDISDETTWDYWVVGHDDDFYIKEEDGALSGVMFHAGDANKYIPITFNENELPDKVVIDSYTFIFSNYSGYNVDIAIVYPNGEIEIIRDVHTSTNWDDYLVLAKAASVSGLVNLTGRVVGAIPCALSVAAAVGTGGFATALAVWTCGNYALGLAADIVEDEFNTHNGFTDFVDTWGLYNTAVACQSGNPVSCATSAASGAIDSWADNLADLEESEEVQVAEGALESGSGDVQITLTWNTTDDIDLWVTDPYDEKIYWYDKNAYSGGYLDFDDMDGFGPENVYWPEDGAPSGSYKVEVDHYDGDYNTNFTVLIQAFGYVKTYYGTVGPNETVLVATFESNSPLPKENENTIRHYLESETK